MNKATLVAGFLTLQPHLHSVYGRPATVLPVNAIPPQLLTVNNTSSNAPPLQTLTLNINTLNLSRLPLFENVQSLLTDIHNSPRPELSHSRLLAVYVSNFDYSETTTVQTMRKIEVCVFPPLPPGMPAPFFDNDVFVYENLVNDRYNQWQGPETQRTQQWDHMDAFVPWDHVNAIMNIEQAEARLKAAGYDRPFAMVQIDVWKVLPLVWCFKFIELDGSLKSIRIEVATGRISHAWSGC
ncbi:MAG: hypothetical protein Q9220_007109 [cf. Caloplaca sp. 1 TL-2023]